MPTYCSIVNCSNTSDKSKDLRFFDIPKIRNNERKEAEELSKKHINRKGFTEKETKGKGGLKSAVNISFLVSLALILTFYLLIKSH